MDSTRTAYVIGLFFACGLLLLAGVLAASGGIAGAAVLTGTVDDGDDSVTMNDPGRFSGTELPVGEPYEQSTTPSLFSLTSSAAEPDVGPNLLENPTCTVAGQGQGDPLYWTVEQGELECNEPETQFMPDPIEGEYVFIDWEDLEPTTDESIATQTIPVTGGSEYQFSVWVGSDEVENDYAQFEVQFLDDGTPIGDGMIDSGEFQPENHEEPDQFVETTTAPANADEAVVRIILVNGGDFGLERPLLWADDVRFQEISDAPTAFDVDGVETGIEQTLAPDWTLFDDEFGEDEDDRGIDDAGEIARFGGGDLGGSVTDNAAGDTVGLAGGELQVNADGSFSLTNPTQTGTFEFEYRLEYGGDHDDAMVTIDVFDHELENPLCEVWDEDQQDQPIGWSGVDFSCLDLEDLSFRDTDHTAVGERSFTDNYITLDDEIETEQTAYVVGEETYTVSGLYGTDSADESGEVDFEYLDADGNVIPGEGFTLDDLQSESTTEFDRFTEVSAAPADAKQATLRLTIVRPSGHQDPAGVYFDDLSIGLDGIASAEVGGAVVDSNAVPSESPIHDASVTLVSPDGTEVETTTNEDGEFTFEDVLETDEAYEITASADGYESNSTAVTVDDGADVEHDVSLTGNAEISGQIEDTTFETGIEGIEVSVENGAGIYTAETDENGEYTVDGVPGTDEEYTVSVDPTGWDGESRTETVGDGVKLTDVDFEITGDAADSVSLSDRVTDEPLAEATVNVEHETFGLAEDAFVTDEDGNMEIVLPGGFTYAYAFSKQGYDTATIPMRSFDPGDGSSANYVLGGNAEITGEVTDSENGDAIEGATVTVTDGSNAYDATTNQHGEYTVAFVPGGHDYDVAIDADGYEAVTESGESVGDGATHTLDAELTGTATLSGTVTDETFETDLDGVEVDVSGEQEYVVETDENGEYAVIVAGTGEEYTVTVDPAGWNAASETVEIDDGDDQTDVDFELSGDAAAEITVEDAETDGSIDGATVIAHNETLGQSDSFETDGDGVAVPTPLPGGFTYEFTIEADGYVDDELTDVFFAEGSSESRTLDLFGNAEITGQVTDDVFGAPIEGVTVTAENGVGVYNATTDENGGYTIENVPGTGEEYVITVDETGYEPVEETVTIGDEANVVQDLVVSGDAEITGQVVDVLTEDGIAGVTVTAENAADTYEATTDTAGAYTIEKLPGEATYDLVADHDDYETATRTDVSVAAGEQRTGNFALDPTAEATVAGTVTDGVTGESIADADVTVELDDSAAVTTLVYETTTDADGSYEVAEVVGGYDYTVTVDADGYERGSTSGSVAEGGTTEIDVTALGNASVSGTVEDAVSGTEIIEASVSVSGQQGTYTAATDENGEFTVENVAGTGEEVEVHVSAAGYESNATTVTIGDGETVENVAFALIGNATIRGQIEDSTFGTGVADVEVSAESGGNAYTAETDADGTYTVIVPGTDEEYTVRAELVGWDENSTTTAVSDGEDVTGVGLELSGEASNAVTLRDRVTDTPLEGGTMTAEHETFGDATATANDTGYARIPLPGGFEYDFTYSKAGYDDYEETKTVDGDVVQSYVLDGNAEIAGQITDSENGEPIRDATVTAQNGAGAYEATTSEGGTYTVENVPGGHDYEVTVERDGYEAVTVFEERVGDEAEHELDVELSGDGAIEVDVVSERTGEGVGDATIEAVGADGAGVYTASTGHDGSVVFDAISSDTSYDFEIANDGYETTTIDDVDLESGETKSLDVALGYSASVDGTVTDWLTGAPIEDVTLEFTANATGESFVVEDATDTDGAYDVAVPGYADIDTTYDVSASVDGYESETERGETVLRPGDSESVDFALRAIGEETVFGEITDAVTGTPIADANVTLDLDDERVDNDLAYETETSADGSYELTGVVGGYDYLLTAKADGYDAEEASLRVDGDEESSFSLAGDGALVLDVVGEQFGDDLADATLEATPADGAGVYGGSHDGDGSYTLDDLPSGGEYAVVVSADGYEPTEFDVLVEDPGITTLSESVSLDGNATLEIEVTDSLIDDSLEGVTVTIEREDDGARFEPAESTDDDGALTATVPGTGGEYTVTANATGYEESSVTTDGVDAGATFPVSITLDGDSTIEGTVRDRVTGEALEEVTVTADADGYLLETTTAEDGAYELSAVPGERSYEMTFEADGYRSNATAVAPSASTETVIESLWLTLEGAGTDEEPYRVTNVVELQAIGGDLDAHYVIDGKIDAVEADDWHDGDGFEPIGDTASPFTGSLDGQENVISSLTVDRADDSAVGLFGAIDGGSIKTLALENVTVVGDEQVGGVAGSLSAGSIDSVATSGSISGVESVGGLAGSGGDISTSTSSATVEGTTAVGGLVGESNEGISGSFAVGQVTGTATTGGLVGAGTPDVDTSYWDVTETTQDRSAGSSDADGLNTTELVGVNATRNTNFEFDHTWAALDDEYPRHGWMIDGIALALADDSLEPGETTEAIVAVDVFDGSTAYANGTATFSSSDPDVLDFENAAVEAIDDGVANLTANLIGLEATVEAAVESPPSPSRVSDIAITGVDYTETELRVNDSVDVTVTLENDGNRGGRYTVDSTLDGEPYEQYNAFVGASQTKHVTFTYVFEEPGTYTATAGGQPVTFTVTDAPNGDETEESTDDTDERSDIEEGAVSDDDADGLDDRADDAESDADGVGFGPLLTLGVLLGVLLVVRHRR